MRRRSKQKNQLSIGTACKALCAIFTAVLLGVPTLASAAPPKDFFVMATQLDEFSSLDPAEIYELVPTEYAANTYDRLILTDLNSPGHFNAEIAQSWKVGADGKTITFTLRPGLRFHSGNPVRADDVVWSLTRAILLDRGPAAVLQSIGLTKQHIADYVKKIDDATVSVTTDQAYAPTFVLSVLGSWAASIVDRQLVESHQVNGDFGNGWLKSHEAGSGAYALVKWSANDSIILQRFDGYRVPLAMKRIVLRHVPEASSQRLLIERGDVDIARNLSPDDLDALKKAGKITVQSAQLGTLMYMGLNMKNPNLAKPEVQEAMRWLVDYQGIQKNLIRSTYTVHQTIEPSGFFGAFNDNPYHQDVAKAKALLAKAGLPNGFSVTMNASNGYPYGVIAQALQANFALAGIRVELIQSDNKQTLGRYRARQHDIYLGEWSPDYLDPHSNAQGFVWNPDNGEQSSYKMLAWRNSWATPVLTQQVQAALTEPSTAKRAQMYVALQKEVLAHSPYIVLFQKVAQVAQRPGVSGLVVGPVNDLVSYRNLKKE